MNLFLASAKSLASIFLSLNSAPSSLMNLFLFINSSLPRLSSIFVTLTLILLSLSRTTRGVLPSVSFGTVFWSIDTSVSKPSLTWILGSFLASYGPLSGWISFLITSISKSWIFSKPCGALTSWTLYLPGLR